MIQNTAKLAQDHQRILSLDIIKAYCIIAVIIRHVAIPEELQLQLLFPFVIRQAVPMFIMCSVYAFSLSEDRRNGTILSWFSTENFGRKIARFLPPFLFAIAVTIAGLFAFVGMKRIDVVQLYKIIRLGGRGPGNYYVVIIFQLLVLFPFLRCLFQKSHFGTVLSLIFAQVLYENFCQTHELSGSLYYVLIFRYLVHLALGFLLYAYCDQLRGSFLPAICIIIGTIYLINICYMGYEQKLVYDYPVTSPVAALFAFGMLCYALRAESVLQSLMTAPVFRKLLLPVLYIGKASYHIMLAQMVYFYFIRRFEMEAQMGKLRNVLLIDLGVSLFSGCLFFALDSYSRKLFSNLRKKVTK